MMPRLTEKPESSSRPLYFFTMLGGAIIRSSWSTIAGFLSEFFAPLSHVSDTANPHAVDKSQVGLDQVDNTSDANKPISTATQAAIDSTIHFDVVQELTPEQTMQALSNTGIANVKSITLNLTTGALDLVGSDGAPFHILLNTGPSP